ncbi:MAG: hypothetical protein KDD37_04245 [Bdellovibrionales bacterium]|nr:hypothetical protein [Bdellovibrionales bacterium]
MGAEKFDDNNRQLSDDISLNTTVVELDPDFISSMSSGDNLKATVLSLAKTGSFDLAKSELKFYQQQNMSTPGFEFRTKHYFAHCMELLDAIDNLKHIPNFESLRAAQQKQIRERIMVYGQDLSSILGRIDKVTNDLKIQDIRSTMWVLRTATFCVAGIIFMLAMIEGVHTVGSPITTVANQIYNWIIYILEHS